MAVSSRDLCPYPLGISMPAWNYENYIQGKKNTEKIQNNFYHPIKANVAWGEKNMKNL